MSATDRATTGDEALLGRLRQLSLVDPDALLSGTQGSARAELLAALADDLHDALCSARARMAELMIDIQGGPDPLAIVEAAAAMRAQPNAPSAAERAAGRLTGRADSCRRLARFDEACARLLPRLIDVQRRRTG